MIQANYMLKCNTLLLSIAELLYFSSLCSPSRYNKGLPWKWDSLWPCPLFAFFELPWTLRITC